MNKNDYEIAIQTGVNKALDWLADHRFIHDREKSILFDSIIKEE